LSFCCEFELDLALKFISNIPDKYLIKSMRGANMTLQKCQKKNIAKKFEFKFDYYLGFPENVFFKFEFYL